MTRARAKRVEVGSFDDNRDGCGAAAPILGHIPRREKRILILTRAKRATMQAKAMMTMAAINRIEVKSEVAGKIADISAERIRQLAKDGWIKKIARDRYRLVDIIRGVAAFRADEQRRSAISSERARLVAARAEAIELRTLREAKVLCETQEALGVLDEAIGGMKADLLSLPARITRDLAVRNRLENEITQLLQRAADRAFVCGGKLEGAEK